MNAFSFLLGNLPLSKDCICVVRWLPPPFPFPIPVLWYFLCATHTTLFLMIATRSTPCYLFLARETAFAHPLISITLDIVPSSLSSVVYKARVTTKLGLDHH